MDAQRAPESAAPRGHPNEPILAKSQESTDPVLFLDCINFPQAHAPAKRGVLQIVQFRGIQVQEARNVGWYDELISLGQAPGLRTQVSNARSTSSDDLRPATFVRVTLHSTVVFRLLFEPVTKPMTITDLDRAELRGRTYSEREPLTSVYEEGPMARSRQILLAEADSASAQLLSFSLQREGFEVVVARDGADALRLSRERCVDAVLAEVLLPDIDGYTMCRELRGQLSTRRIPIVLVSSLGNSEDRIEGLLAGADDFIVKPYDMRELLIKLQRLIATYSDCYQLHPVTRLPGSQLIEPVVERLCAEGDRMWALLHVELHHFGAYNELYGYKAGDNVLRMTGELLREVIYGSGDDLALVGHEGGDDFVAVVPLEGSNELCTELLRRFDQEVPQFYLPEHRDGSYQVLTDRRGKTLLVPNLALSIGVATSDLCENMSYLEMREVARAVAARAKAQERSALFVNRRHLVGRVASSE